MAIERQIQMYEVPGGSVESMWVADQGAGEQPGLLLFPNFLGTKEADFARAEQIAALGFKVLVVDFYGVGKRGTDMASGAALMEDLVADRELMRQKLQVHLAYLQSLPGVRAGRVAAVGYCLGGKCVLDLARAGGDLAGVVLHGVYDPPSFDNAVMKASLLIFHGWNDPLCPPAALIGLGNELTTGGIEWRVVAFGNTGHAFTDETMPLDDARTFGFVTEAERASWDAMSGFLLGSF